MSENRPSELMEQIERLRREMDLVGVYDNLNHRGVWLQICSALDILDDTELAIYAYNPDKLTESSIFIGMKYLQVYGVMQAAQLKIDAVKRIEEIQGHATFKTKTAVKQIANARNLIAGHPMRQVSNKVETSSFTSQVEIQDGRLKVTKVVKSSENHLEYNVEEFELGRMLRNLDRATIDSLSEIEYKTLCK